MDFLFGIKVQISIVHATMEAHIMASLKVTYGQVEYPLIKSIKESTMVNVAFNKK